MLSVLREKLFPISLALECAFSVIATHFWKEPWAGTWKTPVQSHVPSFSNVLLWRESLLHLLGGGRTCRVHH